MAETAQFQDDFYTADEYGKAYEFFADGLQPTTDILAPHPDLFDTELESLVADIDPSFQLDLLNNSTEAFTRLRSDTPTRGPASAITSDSASAYDSFSAYSESIYHSTFDTHTNYSLPTGLDLEMFRALDVTSDYGVPQILEGVDPTFGAVMPPTPPRSPPNHGASNGKVYSSRSYSDYTPSRNVDYYSVTSYGSALNPTVSPTNVSSPLPPTSLSISQGVEEGKGDARKKYKCNVCPRAFARAYNLKTHMATHDPNREKPFVCSHRSCGRSFSRKHDLGRHLISIHRDESVCSSHHSASSKKSVGVDKGARTWCEGCGKSWIGRNGQCNCNPDIK